MLPVAQTANQELRGGISEFIKRRARRILPPYYAALAFSLLLIALIPGLKHPVGGVWNDTFHISVPAFTAQALIPHILLIHNLVSDWAYKINSPMWSVATEWQIYFLFALLLLPVWRRFGWVGAIAAAIVLGYGPHYLPHRKLDVACPWFLALFGMGMAAASANFGPMARPAGEKHPVPWSGIAAAAAGIVIFLSAWKPEWTELHFYGVDLVAGIGSACMLIACTRCLQRDETRLPFGLRIVNAPATVGLGIFSYTIYLIHRPILLAIEALYTRANMSPITEFWTLLFAGVPMVLVISYVFHLLFERRFMNIPAKSK
jgi:peptidoglycan/LPS O-acetylase OafA/YrhL